jgi:hypothetical protein
MYGYRGMVTNEKLRTSARSRGVAKLPRRAWGMLTPAGPSGESATVGDWTDGSGAFMATATLAGVRGL